MLWANYPVTCIILIQCCLASSQAGKYRQGDQAESRGKAMRTGDFWEEESSVCSCDPNTEEASCDCLAEQVTWLTDKNNVIRVNKKILS